MRTFPVFLAILGIARSPRVSKADAPDGHFSHGEDGVVRDAKTGLVWQRKALATPTTWQDAQTSCGTLGGQRGWRLPSIKELQTIIDRNRSDPAVDPRYFDLPPARFWTSSGYGSGRRFAWWVNVANGTSGYEDVAALHLILCVR